MNSSVGRRNATSRAAVIKLVLVLPVTNLRITSEHDTCMYGQLLNLGRPGKPCKQNDACSRTQLSITALQRARITPVASTYPTQTEKRALYRYHLTQRHLLHPSIPAAPNKTTEPPSNSPHPSRQPHAKIHPLSLDWDQSFPVAASVLRYKRRGLRR